MSTKYKTMMSNFQSCQVPPPPGAQRTPKLQVFSLRKSLSAQFVLNLSRALQRSSAELSVGFWLSISPAVLNSGRQGICISHFSRDLWVQNQPFCLYVRISKTLLRSSCICFTAKTAISIKHKKKRRAVVCTDDPFKKDPRFISEVVFKRMTMAKNRY